MLEAITCLGQALLACVVIAALGVSQSRATTLRKLSLEELVAHSDTIVVGRCEKTETAWLDKKIYTIATIRVGQLVKGKVETGGAIKVYILGGRVKEPIPIKMHVPGAPKVGQGEEMVLFLESRGGKKPYHRFVGMRQGRVPVFTDPKTGEKHVRYGERIKGVRMVDRDGKPLPPNAQLGPAKAGSLDGFVGRVHQIIATQAARPRTTTTRPADEPAPRRNPQPASKEGGK